jgi:hypothetical protein
MMWDQAQAEITFVKERVKTALVDKEPTIKNIWDLIFGPESNIGRLLMEKTKLNIMDLHKILGIFCLAAAYNLSKTQNFQQASFRIH